MTVIITVPKDGFLPDRLFLALDGEIPLLCSFFIKLHKLDKK